MDENKTERQYGIILGCKLPVGWQILAYGQKVASEGIWSAAEVLSSPARRRGGSFRGRLLLDPATATWGHRRWHGMVSAEMNCSESWTKSRLNHTNLLKLEQNWTCVGMPFCKLPSPRTLYPSSSWPLPLTFSPFPSSFLPPLKLRKNVSLAFCIPTCLKHSLPLASERMLSSAPLGSLISFSSWSLCWLLFNSLHPLNISALRFFLPFIFLPHKLSRAFSSTPLVLITTSGGGPANDTSSSAFLPNSRPTVLISPVTSSQTVSCLSCSKHTSLSSFPRSPPSPGFSNPVEVFSSSRSSKSENEDSSRSCPIHLLPHPLHLSFLNSNCVSLVCIISKL